MKVKSHIAAQLEMTVLFAQELRFLNFILSFDQGCMFDFLNFLIFGFFVGVCHIVLFLLLLIGIAYFRAGVLLLDPHVG